MSNISPVSATPADSPWTTVSRSSGKLPVPMTPILGREGETARILGLLNRDDTRVVTLTGPGGVGKTRLALEVASRVARDFAHGVCFVPLASIRSPGLVPKTVAQCLGIQESAERSAMELLATLLSDQHLLLVLDNMEQVVMEASTWLSGLLTDGPRLKVLATSRIALNISGERRFIVPPLTLPGVAGAESTGSPAMLLFAQRAGAVNSSFELDDQTIPSVAEICRRLDGLPLAIELAAARTRAFLPSVILDRLENRLAFLTGGYRDSPERLQTIRSAIAWSCDLLADEERSLFRLLSVFAGGFTLDAAEFIALDTGLVESASAVIDLLESLVDQSLVQSDPVGSSAPRYSTLETIREFGQHELAMFDPEGRARRAHATFYLNLSKEAELGLRGPRQAEWMNRLDAEHDNLRASIAWLIANNQSDDASALIFNVLFFYTGRCHVREGQGYLEQCLSSGSGNLHSRARALVASGAFAWWLDDYASAIERLESSIEILQAQDDRQGIALALTYLGSSYLVVGNMPRAGEMWQRAVDISRQIGYARGESAGLLRLSGIAMSMGEHDRATELRRQSARVAERSGDLRFIVNGKLYLAQQAVFVNDLETAEAAILEASQIAGQLGSVFDLQAVHRTLAAIARARGDFHSCVAHARTALEFAERVGDRLNAANNLLSIGQVACELGDIAQSKAALHDAADYYLALGIQIGVVECLDSFAALALAVQDARVAAQLLGSADAMLAANGIQRSEGFSASSYSRMTETLKSVLGDDDFATAWAAGRALSLEAAIAAAWKVEAVSILSAPTSGASSALPSGLTHRQVEVLRLVAEGHSNRGIAELLSISERTVEGHVDHILNKLGLESRTAAAAFAIRTGLA